MYTDIQSEYLPLQKDIIASILYNILATIIVMWHTVFVERVITYNTMAQVSLYIHDEMLKKLKQSAKAEKVSLSQLVVHRLEQSYATQWPQGYFDLFGSVSDESFQRPKQGSLEDDMKREQL